jgi:UPF0042 nucleotide-binding protein
VTTTARDVWLVTGPSGAGKATARAALQEAGVHTVDNLPLPLLAGFIALRGGDGEVLFVDARAAAEDPAFSGRPGLRVLFLDARDDVLLRRVGDTRRPMAAGHGKGRDALNAERAALAALRASADCVLDTSELSPEQLGDRVRGIVVRTADTRRLLCTVSSFGFKYGPQPEADWVVDTRLMANPFWVPELRPLNGRDAAVRDYVLRQQEAAQLLTALVPLIAWAAERGAAHDRQHLHVALGCTGGRHRSVVLAEELASRLRSEGVDVELRHRDVERPDPRLP